MSSQRAQNIGPPRPIPAVGTVGTLCNRDIIRIQGADETGMKLYNQLKDWYSDVPMKDFQDLTLHDIAGDNVVYIIHDHFRRLRSNFIPKGMCACCFILVLYQQQWNWCD